jgi:hypothetical protein
MIRTRTRHPYRSTAEGFRLQEVKITPDAERFWAVGIGSGAREAPEGRLVHRVVGAWRCDVLGNRHETACGRELSWNLERFESMEEIPAIYKLCLRCIAKDEQVE